MAWHAYTMPDSTSTLLIYLFFYQKQKEVYCIVQLLQLTPPMRHLGSPSLKKSLSLKSNNNNLQDQNGMITVDRRSSRCSR